MYSKWVLMLNECLQFVIMFVHMCIILVGCQ